MKSGCCEVKRQVLSAGYLEPMMISSGLMWDGSKSIEKSELTFSIPITGPHTGETRSVQGVPQEV